MRVKQRNILIAGFMVVFFTLALTLSIFVITRPDSQDDRSGAQEGEPDPACTDFSVDKTSVTAEDEEITIVAKGQYGTANPTIIQVYATIAGQTNKNADNFGCTNDDPADDEYSFYCAGTEVWKLIEDANNTKELSVTKTYSELKQMVKSNLDTNEITYEGTIDEKGIVVAVNVHAKNSENVTNICSSNIAHNGGNGALYNGGAWDASCQGGCYETITLTQTAKPAAACESIEISKSTVTDINEKITITINAVADDENPDNIFLYAAAGGQVNKNPEDFDCEEEDKNDPEYSFYCGGLKAWNQISKVDGKKTLTFETTFAELMGAVNKGVDDGGNEFEGSLEEKGVHVAANVNNSNPTEYCSSNIARNNGQGTKSTDGSTWDTACNNACQQLITLSAGGGGSCDEDCTSSDDCDSGLICSGGKCRNSECTAQTDCQCQPTNVSCNGECSQTSDCQTGLVCSGGRCRNSQCTSETDCACNQAPPPPANIQCNGSCTSSSQCAGSLTCVSGYCKNSSCSTDADCICNYDPTGGDNQLPNTAEGDEVYLILFGAILMIGTALVIAKPGIFGLSFEREKRPEKFRRDF